MVTGPAVRRPAAGELPPIQDYALIGDTRTAALVSSQGAIDWLCIPRFDGPPVFGRLVGGRPAGTFRMGPQHRAPVAARAYRPETATVRTTWQLGSSRLTLTEAMVSEVEGRLLPATLLVRRLSAEGAAVSAVVEFDPRLGERHRAPRTRRGPHGLTCSWGTAALSLSGTPDTGIQPGRSTTVLVVPGRPVTLAMAVADREPLIEVPAAYAWDLLCDDESRWRAWAAEVCEQTPYRDTVVRHLLTLRLLTYAPSGAPVAAPTTSLPEQLGGVRNWDYRYAWPRDASIGVGAFLGAGKPREAWAFLAWLLHASRLERPRLPVLLTLDGRYAPPERSLPGWPGYADSVPVRVGNGAAGQHQLDGYGWVLDAGWLLELAGHRLYGETWRAMASFADLVSRRWADPDEGIWEVRGGPAHHVHSKVMAWLALDRALKLADRHRVSTRRRRRWAQARADLAASVTAYGFDLARQTFTRSYGSSDLDAALLVLPVLNPGFADRAQLRGTIAAIRRELGAGGPLLYRYPPGQDGLPGEEGAFLPCSFWLVQALASVGEAAQARELFEELLELASPLGLYAEEIDPLSRAHLGNFPQALSSAALVQAALALRDAERAER